MDEPKRTRGELIQLRDMAKRLGFWNDYNHWQSELDKLEKKGQ